MVLVGAAAIGAQIVFIRELLVVFYGNELSVAFVFASWLIGGAIGSAVLGRAFDSIRNKTALFAGCQALLGIILPLSIIAIRAIKPVLKMNPGEIMPFFPTVVSGFVVLIPACAILGLIFAIACRIAAGNSRQAAGRIGAIYVLESLGSVLGGLFVSSVLMRLLDPVVIMAFFGILLGISSVAVIAGLRDSGGRRILLAAAAGLLLVELLALPLGIWKNLEQKSLERQWGGYSLVSSKNSIYGNVAVTRNGAQFSFFDNGLHLYTIPDRKTSEESVHFALLEHPAPERVLLIGGGVGGLIEEILKHPVKKVDYVELDPLILTMARDHLPHDYYKPLEDGRVALRFEDGRRYVKTTGERYDVVIIRLGDPYTAGLNRFYTEEFFGEAKRILKRGGLLSFGLSGAESYMSREMRDFLGSIYATVTAQFKDVKVIPGDTATFLASNERGFLTLDYKVLMERARKRSLDIRYVREYYLASLLSPEKVLYAQTAIATAGRETNRDFRPISYYYDMVFWTAHFKDSLFTKMLKAAKPKVVWTVVGMLSLALLVSGSARGRARALSRAALTVITVNGFTQIVFQVVLLLAFQIIYGYLFYKLGFIITAFMAGIVAGGWYAIRSIAALAGCRPGLRPSLIGAQVVLCLYAAALPAAFRWLASAPGGLVSWIGSNVIFIFLSFVCGSIGGYLFPLVNRAYLGASAGESRSGGLTYGMDLFGSCVGALMAGTFLVPILGIPNTCYAVSIINAAVLAILVLAREDNLTGGAR